jgi:prevent-host-death family protein
MVVDHSILGAKMETLAISKFKATCLAVLERVRRTGQTVLVTRFGEPVAQITPPPVAARGGRWLGSFRDSGEIVGDVVAPASDEEDWDVLRA